MPLLSMQHATALGNLQNAFAGRLQHAGHCAGVSLEMASASSFWALFQAGGAERPWEAHADQVQQRGRFCVSGLTRRGSHIHTSFVMHFS